jgi:hypothetical protein
MHYTITNIFGIVKQNAIPAKPRTGRANEELSPFHFGVDAVNSRLHAVIGLYSVGDFLYPFPSGGVAEHREVFMVSVFSCFMALQIQG